LGSSDTVKRRAERVEVRQFIEGAGRLAHHHLQRDPLGAVRNFWDYQGSIPPSSVLVKIGIERHGPKAFGTGRGPPIYRGCRALAGRLAHHLQRDPLGAVRNFGTTDDRRPLLRYSSRLGSSDTVKRRAEGFEVRQVIEGTSPQRRVLGSPPSTRPSRYCTQLLGLPRIDASFQGTSQDWE
jgi:hypothetical protein